MSHRSLELFAPTGTLKIVIGIVLAAVTCAGLAQTTATADIGLSGVWTNDPPEETLAFQNNTFSAEPPAFTDWGQARFDAAKPSRGARGVSVTETDDPVYACFPPGVPRIYLHPFPMEIVQTDNRVLMIFEYDHFIRQIYMGGREHRTDLAPTWMGDSIGWIEGDTLVVESVNFNDKTWLDRTGVPHSESLRVIERIRLIDEDLLEIDITMEDPIALDGPWVAETIYYRLAPPNWELSEISCSGDYLDFSKFEDFLEEDSE